MDERTTTIDSIVRNHGSTWAAAAAAYDAAVAAERERWEEALRLLRDAVRAQNRAGTSWPTQVFAQMMDGLARADALLDWPNVRAKRA